MSKVRVNWHSGGDLLPATDMPMPFFTTIKNEAEITKAELTKNESLAAKGRELWSELHTSLTIDTLAEWERRIPSFGCTCRKFYDEWKASNPPSAALFFKWTVDLHNAVNAKLGKIVVTYEEARRLWMV